MSGSSSKHFFFPYCKALVAQGPGPLPHLETTIRLSPLLCGYETGKIWGKPSNSPKFRANLWDLCWKIPTSLPSSMSIIPPEVSTRIRVENPQVHPAAWHDARQSPPITEMKKQSWTGHETPCGSKNFGGRNLNCWAAKWRSGWSTSWTNICINICMHVYKYNICVHVRVWVLWTGKHTEIKMLRSSEWKPPWLQNNPSVHSLVRIHAFTDLCCGLHDVRKQSTSNTWKNILQHQGKRINTVSLAHSHFSSVSDVLNVQNVENIWDTVYNSYISCPVAMHDLPKP